LDRNSAVDETCLTLVAEGEETAFDNDKVFDKLSALVSEEKCSSDLSNLLLKLT
jgi:hypothetical protein